MRDSYSRLLPGQLFGGKYRIEAQVAEGGMGVVLKATHIDLECAVAIKIIRPEHAENEDFVARLLAEARIAASLRSKHVNRVLDVGRTSSGIPYLVLEYMDGSDLACHLEKCGRFNSAAAVDCLIQACEALAEAHATGIVHRDLKPENMFLNEETDGSLVLKVLDFGISKGPASRRNGRSLTHPWEVVGTPSYMAPEQIEGAVVDSRADIWALGVILHELCTGAPPFEADAVPDIFALVLDKREVRLSMDRAEVPEGLEAVIAKCLRKNREERFQSVVELAEALASYGSGGVPAERVAKVAATTSARIVAMQAALDGTGPGPISGATPLALAATKFDSKASNRRRRKGPRWLLLGIAAAVPFALGFGYIATRGSAVAPSADSRIVGAQPLPPQSSSAPAIGLADVGAAPSINAEPAEPSATDAKARKSRARSRPQYGLVKAATDSAAPIEPGPGIAAGLKTPPLLPSGQSAPALSAPAAASANKTNDERATDAWNPKSFGGRR